MIRPIAVGILAFVWLFPSGCSESVGPDTSDQVRIVPTSPSFALTVDYLGQEEGELEVEVTNLNDIPLYVFSSCGNPGFRLQRKIQPSWVEVGLAPGCMMGPGATDVPAGESRLFSLGVLIKGSLGDGTYRVDLHTISWLSDWDEYLKAAPLPLSSRLSDEFQIVVENGEVDL